MRKGKPMLKQVKSVKKDKPRGKLKVASKRGGMTFKYKERSPDLLKQRAEQRGGRFDSPYKQQYNLWKPKGGDNTIRIMPPSWDENDHYGYDIWLHRWIGNDNSNYLCLARKGRKGEATGKFCPICAAAKDAKDAGEADEAKQLEAAHVVLVWMIDRDKEDDGPLLWPMSWAQDRDIASVCQDKKRGKVYVPDHPEVGYDITFRREGEGLKTRYSAYQVDREDTPLSEDQDKKEEWLDFISENPLPDVLQPYDAKYLQNVLAGQVEAKDEDLDDEDEDEDDDKPRKRPTKVKSRRAVDDDDEDADDDDEEADDEDDDDDDDEPVARRGRGKTKAKVEDEDEEDEDEAEDDDDDDSDEDDDADDDDDDDDDADEEEDEGEDDDEKPARRPAAARKRQAPAAKRRRR